MTERARDAEPRDVIAGIHRGLQTHDSIHLEQRDRRRRTLEIDLLEDTGRQYVRVHLEPDLQRSRRIHALLDNLVPAELVGPELFVTECLEAKNAAALVNLGCGRRLIGSRLRGGRGWRAVGS